MANNKISYSNFKVEYKKIKPGAYLFYGEENLLKQRELLSIRNKFCEDKDLSQLNHYIFTRDNYSAEAFYFAVQAMPMMNDYKLIELYELPFSDFRKKDDFDGIERALKSASQSDDTILIIYTTPETFDCDDTRSPLSYMKMFLEYAVPVEFAHESTQRIVTWVQKHFSSEKIIAEPMECNWLIEVVGHDMATLENEISKLCAFLHFKERDKLNKVDIDLICPHNQEIGAFEFADAILDANNQKAFYILNDMRSKNEPVPVILGSIIKIYTNMYSLKLYSAAGISHEEAAKRLVMHPYAAKLRLAKLKNIDKRALYEIIKLCSETDDALKKSAVNDYVLLERLIVKASLIRQRKVF